MREFCENLLDKIMSYFPVFIIAMIVFLIVGIFEMVYQGVETNKNCARWEEKIVHQDAWTQYIYSGKMMVPIYHPAGDYPRNVCVQPRG